MQKVKETLTNENNMLKGKLSEVYDIQKSLKNKFDSNIDSLEHLEKRENDHQVEVRS